MPIAAAIANKPPIAVEIALVSPIGLVGTVVIHPLRDRALGSLRRQRFARGPKAGYRRAINFSKTIKHDTFNLVSRWVWRVDTGDLKVFEAVARLGGMNRAAAELNTVQSNVTARVKALETDLSCVLFERHARGVSLTAAGQRLLPYANSAARLLADARRATRDDGVPRGLLTIGSLETTAALHLTPLLAGYAAEYPEVDLVLRTGTTRELIGEVLGGRLDGAFVCGPVAHAELLEEVVFREELIMLAAP